MPNAAEKKTVVLISAGLCEPNLLLQPWRYLFKTAQGLSEAGFQVILISDGSRDLSREELRGLPLVRLPSLRSVPGQRHSLLRWALSEIRPHVILWNVGLTSLVYQDFRLCPKAVNIAIFTSPIYSLVELARLGPLKLIRHHSITAVHLLGSLLPQSYLCSRLSRSGLCLIVTQTRTTSDQLRQAGLWTGRIDVIPPGVDEVWQSLLPAQRLLARQELGFSLRDFVVVYFGSPAPLRGLPALVDAVELARRENPFLKLLVLSRRRPGELRSEDRYLSRFSSSSLAYIHLVDGFLDPPALVRFVDAADLVALPFVLVPSDAPLGLLEAQALGKPILTTQMVCLPELVSESTRFLTASSHPRFIAKAIACASHDLELNRNSWKETDREVPRQSTHRAWEDVKVEWNDLLLSL